MRTRRLFVALFVIALFAMATRETLDPDMWWHLRTGEFILNNGIPRQDIFSFTVPDRRWITHEWLSQVFMWLVYGVAGLPGLMLTFAGIITLTFGLVYRRSAGRPFLAAFIVLLAAFAAAITWGARPQMFNLLLLALFVYIVEGVREKHLRSVFLWLLPMLTALWANLHSGYLLGVALLAAYTVGLSLQLWLVGGGNFDLARRDLRNLALVTVVCLVAALLNPNGYLLWLYPFETLGSSAMQRHIQEWHPPDFHEPIFWPFAALIALGVFSWSFSRQRPPLTDVLIFLGTAGAGLLSARHIPIFAIVATPITARSVRSLLADTRAGAVLGSEGADANTGRWQVALNWFLLALFMLAAVLWASNKVVSNAEAIAAQYPVAAVDFLEQEGLAQKQGYNDYGWGGYLIWRGVPVFVDGRADVYGDDFLFYYLQAFEVTEKWYEPLYDFDVAYVLMARGTPLTTLLSVSDDWQEAFADELAQVFVRTQP